MLIIGFVIGILIFETEFLSISSFLKLISLIISGVLAWIFSIIVNDITDFKIDLISNNKRPFVNKILNLDQYKLIGCISLIFSLMFSYIVGEKFLLGFLIIILLSLVYSIYPLRLKRFLIISRLPLALVAAILILLGFMLTSQDGAISIFPKKILFGAIIALLFSTNFIDIKDTAGDKKEGIKTITTKFGLRDGKIIISLFMGISYISLPIIFNIYTLIIPSIIISFINHVYLTKTKYEERLIFGLYFFYILLLSIYILLNKSIILS